MLFFRSSHPGVFLEKDVLKICSKFTREHPCRSVISIKLRNKSLFGTGILQYIWCIFPEHLFIRAILDGCFWFLDEGVPVVKYVSMEYLENANVSIWKKQLKKYWRYLSGTSCDIWKKILVRINLDEASVSMGRKRDVATLLKESLLEVVRCFNHILEQHFKTSNHSNDWSDIYESLLSLPEFAKKKNTKRT